MASKRSLKDQLKDWKQHKKDVDEELRDLRKEAKKPAPPPPKPPVEDERELSDEELFRRAVEGIQRGSDAVLQKYDRTDAPRSSVSPEAAREITDRALFLDAVGGASREEALRSKSADAQAPAKDDDDGSQLRRGRNR